VRTVAEFLQALGGPPSRAREKDVRNYVVALQQQQQQQQRASSSVNVAIAAIACPRDARYPALSNGRARRAPRCVHDVR
jgi:hypothetical protein